jgi:hypothetical protein
MAYTKTVWKDLVAAVKNKFAKSEETSGSVRLTFAPEGVSQQGTPFSAENMNKIEQGIADAHQGLNDLSSDLRWKADSGPWGPRLVVPSGTAGWFSLFRIFDIEAGLQYKARSHAFGDVIGSAFYIDFWIHTRNNDNVFMTASPSSLAVVAEIHAMNSFSSYLPLGIIINPAASGKADRLDISIVAYLKAPSYHFKSTILKSECLGTATQIAATNFSYDLTQVKLKDDATPNSPPPGFWYINQAVFSYAPSAISADSPVVMRFSSVQSSPLQ